MLKFAFEKWMKALCIFTLVFFVMSMTGAAACSSSSSTKYKTDAISDTCSVSASQTSKTFNVLANDKGCGLKVVTTGYITTAKGGKVLMKSRITSYNVCYTKLLRYVKLSLLFEQATGFT